MNKRRSVLKAISSIPVLLPQQWSFAQNTNWPESTIKIIVPFTAGGASDVLTRLIAEKLQSKFNQNVVVDNRTGAGGNIGMEAVKNAPADGYTISSATIGTLAINQFLFSKLNYLV